MIKVDLEIGNPVETRVYHNMYELVVGYEHGDADGNTDSTRWYQIGKEDELKLDLLGLFVASTVIQSWGELTYELAKIYHAQGVEDSYERAEQFGDNFYEGDITNEGEGAKCTGYELFFHDAYGVKREVHVDLNGKRV